MAAIIGVIAFAVLVGIFFLLRGMGRMHTQPSGTVRARHSASIPEEPRTSGLN